MRPRKYINRIEVWRNDYDPANDDGAGGNTGGPGEQLGSSWCNIRTIPQNKFIDYGLDENRIAITITVRHREDLDYEQDNLYFKYKGKEYYPSSVTERNLDGREFIIVAQA